MLGILSGDLNSQGIAFLLHGMIISYLDVGYPYLSNNFGDRESVSGIKMLSMWLRSLLSTAGMEDTMGLDRTGQGVWEGEVGLDMKDCKVDMVCHISHESAHN